jgi:hypothetical protein
MKRVLVFLLLDILLFALSCAAQTVTPVIAEGHGAKARGEFTVQNNGLKPLDVQIEPLSFDVGQDGTPHYRPLDVATVHLKMDSFSAHVGIRQSHTFFYEVRCEHQPCWLAIFSAMTVGKNSQGLNVALHVGHTIYLCSSEKRCRDFVRKKVWGLPQ